MHFDVAVSSALFRFRYSVFHCLLCNWLPKKTVRGNLKLAFPNKTEAERLQIEKDSFKHLCDMFLEMAKTMTISRRQIDKRFKFNNLDTYLELEKKGKVLHCYVLIMLVMNGLYH